MTPFLTFYTPTYHRPQGLARCMASVQEQTIADQIEHIILPDYSEGGGEAGVGRMFGRIPLYVDAVHGQYVHILCDDDELVSSVVVENVRDFAETEGHPELIIVDVVKGEHQLPIVPAWPPRLGCIDLGCGIVRSDVWKKHVTGYCASYDGDFKFFSALHNAGVEPILFPMPFLIGAVSHGSEEAA